MLTQEYELGVKDTVRKLVVGDSLKSCTVQYGCDTIIDPGSYPVGPVESHGGRKHERGEKRRGLGLSPKHVHIQNWSTACKRTGAAQEVEGNH